MAYTTTDQHQSGISAAAKLRPLRGMKAICAYMGKSENTVLRYIRDEGLPAGKIGGEWVSDEVSIDAWHTSRYVI
jgi:predicted DNA-binding transcriptional regulator AlpA